MTSNHHLFIFQDEVKHWHGIKETPSGRASIFKPTLTQDNNIKWTHDFYSIYTPNYFEHTYALLDYTPCVHDTMIIKDNWRGGSNTPLPTPSRDDE